MPFRLPRGVARAWAVVAAFIVVLAACAPSAPESAFVSPSGALPRTTPTVASGLARRVATPARTPRAAQGAPGGQALVYLDAGHGGVDTGAQGTGPDGKPIFEKNFTLAIAQLTAARLRADGVSVELSRNDDSLPGSVPDDYTANGQLLTAEGVLADLQRRIDRANDSGALVLLSIHINAFSDPAVGGAETFYDSARPFASENQRFATLVQGSVVKALQARGVPVADRGVTDDASLVGEALGTLGASYRYLVLLGPPVPGRLRSSEMPGALSEPLFISNPREANALAQPEVQQALATAYAQAIEEFLRSGS